MKIRRIGRRASFAGILIVSVAFAAGGMVGAKWIRSPQEAAASRRPPAASILTAAVEYRVLVDKLVTRGDVVVGRRLDVALVASGETNPVVTGMRVRRGQRVKSGQAVIEVSGRPVIVLAGRAPAYRDLRPGANGKDVRQLQSALRDSGHPIASDTLGTLGAGTQRALRGLYAAIGYDVPTTGNEADVESARSGVKQAERAHDAARLTLHRARSTQGKPGAAATQEIQDAELAVRYAAEDLADAESLLARSIAVSGPMLPISEVVFVPDLPATVATVNLAVGSPGAGVALTLDMGVPRITTKVDPQSRSLIREGMAVKVLVRELDREVDATISSIGPEADDGQGGLAHVVTITPATGLPRSAVGENVRITATTASTTSKVLVVPLSAVTSSADGTTNVTVLEKPGEHRRVRVSPGVSAEGYVEVAPVKTGDLVEGDRVVVGKQ